MIEVFHILAVTGGGDAKAMAGGVARSTIPAMAGLMAAIPASIAARWLDNNVRKKTDLLSERLTYE
jgi:biopolymer transport protein ExbB